MLKRVLFVLLAMILPARAGDAVPKLDPKGAEAQGKPYRAESEGAQVTIPGGWNYRETEDGLALGSDTEAGLIFVWLSRAKGDAAIEREFAGALAGTGAQFGALEGLQTVKLQGGDTRYAESAGSDAQGTAVRARLLAVQGKESMVMVGGLTTDEASRMENIRKRVDSMARSVKFFTVDRTQAKNVVAGQWWSYKAAATGGGSERTMAFCSDGRYFEQSESGYYGSGWGVAGQGGGAGRWSAAGTAAAGTVTVTHTDGSTAAYDYAAKTPNDLSFNGREYGRVAPSLCQ